MSELDRWRCSKGQEILQHRLTLALRLQVYNFEITVLLFRITLLRHGKRMRWYGISERHLVCMPLIIQQLTLRWCHSQWFLIMSTLPRRFPRAPCMSTAIIHVSGCLDVQLGFVTLFFASQQIVLVWISEFQLLTFLRCRKHWHPLYDNMSSSTTISISI